MVLVLVFVLFLQFRRVPETSLIWGAIVFNAQLNDRRGPREIYTKRMIILCTGDGIRFTPAAEENG